MCVQHCQTRDIPFIGWFLPRGVTSPLTEDDCLKGELISIRSLAAGPEEPLAGDDRKNSGDEEATFCCDARGVAWAFGDEGACERAGVPDTDLRERREAGDDMAIRSLLRVTMKSQRLLWTWAFKKWRWG